jgi:hypothetical protein
MARRGKAWPGDAWRGLARQGIYEKSDQFGAVRLGTARQSTARHGFAWQGHYETSLDGRGMVWHAKVRWGVVCRGMARLGMAGDLSNEIFSSAQRGTAGLSSAGNGPAWQGKAGEVKTQGRYGKPISARFRRAY